MGDILSQFIRGPQHHTHGARIFIQANYLTDTIDYLVRKGRSVLPVLVDDPGDVLGFNNPSELLEIQERFRLKAEAEAGGERRVAANPGVFKPPAEWARCLANPDGEIQRSLVEVHGILTDIRQVTERLPAMAKILEGEVGDMEGIVLQSQEAIRETTRLLEAVQRHWLIRGYVDQADPSERIPPAQVTPMNGGRP